MNWITQPESNLTSLEAILLLAYFELYSLYNANFNSLPKGNELGLSFKARRRL